MSEGLIESSLCLQLLEIATDPKLREVVYRQLGEYCHQCRNRLNSLKLSLFLALRQSSQEMRGAWAKIERDYLELEQLVDRLQTICRPMPLSRVMLPLDLLFNDRREEWSRLITDGGADLELVHPRHRTLASFDVERIGQALDALVRWRAGGQGLDRVARLRWGVEAGRATINWEEPVPLLDPALDGSNWTLPLIARVAEAHGGGYQISEDSGWRLEMSWPAQLDMN
ncbi:hypothetical protein P12x_004743 [Tundrisphaera lichenicola]|uniref:hypothetical protein n=1 Tax=Tundrisphaera lichenicola TaxID=2029860 RepID=UPI003EB92182